MTDAVFLRDGDAFVATPHAAGPWNPGLQHGGAPSALIAHAAESVPTAAPMRIARITVELMRPVPVARLTVSTQVVREGRNIQLVDVRLHHEGKELTRAMVLRMRIAPHPLPDSAAIEPSPPVPEDGAPGAGFGTGLVPVGFGTGFDVRMIRGGLGEIGPGTMWFRQHRALIAGEPLSPAMRAMAVADFSNGISAVVPFAQWTFLNADLTVNLAREPEGDWILSDAQTWLGPDGMGMAATRLADRKGWFARATQSLLLDPR